MSDIPSLADIKTDRYIVYGLNTRGASGPIYLARDQQTGFDWVFKGEPQSSYHHKLESWNITPAETLTNATLIDPFSRHLVPGFEFKDDNGKNFVRMPYLPMTLDEYLSGDTRKCVINGNLPLIQAIGFSLQIAEGLNELYPLLEKHLQEVVLKDGTLLDRLFYEGCTATVAHSDLKLDNILLEISTRYGEADRINPRIGDHALVSYMDFELLGRKCEGSGSFFARAYELFEGTIFANQAKKERFVSFEGANPSTDMFSMGCMLFNMTFGYYPFEEELRKDKDYFKKQDFKTIEKAVEKKCKDAPWQIRDVLKSSLSPYTYMRYYSPDDLISALKIANSRTSVRNMTLDASARIINSFFDYFSQ